MTACDVLMLIYTMIIPDSKCDHRDHYPHEDPPDVTDWSSSKIKMTRQKGMRRDVMKASLAGLWSLSHLRNAI